ncbi:MAG: C25 family cysteine peptidase [Candidatus Eisenbacteria bacterium]
MVIEFTLRSLQRTVRGAAQTVALHLPGSSSEPEDLPAYSRLLEIPAGYEAEVLVTDIDESSFAEPRIAATEQAKAWGTMSPVAVGRAASMRGLRVAPITFRPVRIDPASGLVRVARHVRASVRFVPVPSASAEGLDNAALPGAALSRAVAPARSFHALAQEMVLGYGGSFGAVRALARDSGGGLPRTEGSGSYVVLCPDDPEVVQRLEPLLDWRRRQGLPVRLATTAETGTTNTAIQAWLRNAYATWDQPPEYIVLAGDAAGDFVIPTWLEQLSGANGEGDHPYTQLDGDDVLADAHIGRLSFSTLTELEVIVNKIVGYETAPDLDDPSWLRRACLVADLADDGGYGGLYPQRWVKERLKEIGYADIDTIFRSTIVQDLATLLNRGDTIYSYRGTLRMSGWTNQMTYALTNGWKMPFVVALTCETGSFFQEGSSITEAFLRANGGVQNPKGAIGAIGTATGDTHTRYNNCMTFGVFQGLLYEGAYRMGPALTRGKLEIYANYQTTEPNSVVIQSYWNNLIGDPAVACWTGYPEPLEVEHAATLPVGTASVPVHVTSAGAPEAGALVCLWDGDEAQAVGCTDESGWIVLPFNATTPANLYLTVTARNRRPYLATVPVEQEPLFVGYETHTIDDDALGESEGNGDGVVNPGETIELRIAVRNFGTSVAPGVTGILTCENPHVTVVDASEPFGDVPAGGLAWCAEDFGFAVDAAAMAGEAIHLGLDLTSGSDTWHSVILLVAAAPDLAAETVIVDDGSGNGLLEPGENGELIVTLRNAGEMGAGTVQAVLRTSNPWIVVADSTANFGAIAAGGTATNAADPFVVSATGNAWRGHPARFSVVTLADGLLVDETSFVLQLGQAGVTDPTGPDAYGYSALDNGDTGYTDAPVFAWIELDPAYGGNGTELPLLDYAKHDDRSCTIDLPFNFSFYGNPYHTATVCANGWISLGSTPLTDYRNGSIPGAGAPPNLIAAFWDDLVQWPTGRVFTKYDPAQHRFIIEWSRLHNQIGGGIETFEAILYDPLYHPSPSGDGRIELQYQTVNNVDVTDGHATVGLQNYDHTDGVLYTYANTYRPGAAALAAGRAIRFVPKLAAARGLVEGTVRNASAGNAPAEGVKVRVLGMDEGAARTSPTGEYSLHLPAGSYTLIAESSQFAADSLGGIEVALDFPVVADFSLVDVAGPEFSNVTRYTHNSSPGPYTIQATIEDASPILEATLTYRIGGGTWVDLPLSLVSGVWQAAIPATTVGREVEYYMTARDGADHETTDPSGAPGSVHSFFVTEITYAQTVETADHGWLLGLPGDDAVFGDWTRADPTASFFDEHLMRPEDDHTPAPGAYCFSTGATGWSGVYSGCTTLQSPVFDLHEAGEAWVSYFRWFADRWAWAPEEGIVVTVSSDGGASWHPLEVVGETIRFWTGSEFRLSDTIDLTSQVVFRFRVCDDPDDSSYVVALLDDFLLETIPRDQASTDGGMATRQFALYPVRPNPPAGGDAVIAFSLEEADEATLRIYDVQGRLVKTLVDGTLDAGSHEALWNGRNDAGADAGSGVYFCRLQSGGRTAVRKLVRLTP